MIPLIRLKNFGHDLFFWFLLTKVSPATSEMCEWKSGLRKNSHIFDNRWFPAIVKKWAA